MGKRGKQRVNFLCISLCNSNQTNRNLIMNYGDFLSVVLVLFSLNLLLHKLCFSHFSVHVFSIACLQKIVKMNNLNSIIICFFCAKLF